MSLLAPVASLVCEQHQRSFYSRIQLPSTFRHSTSLKHVLCRWWLICSATMSCKHVSVASRTVEMALTKHKLLGMTRGVALGARALPGRRKNLGPNLQGKFVSVPPRQRKKVCSCYKVHKVFPKCKVQFAGVEWQWFRLIFWHYYCTINRVEKRKLKLTTADRTLASIKQTTVQHDIKTETRHA